MADLRIRVRLPTNLLEQLTVVAASNKISLNRLVEHILREYLLRRNTFGASKKGNAMSDYFVFFWCNEAAQVNARAYDEKRKMLGCAADYIYAQANEEDQEEEKIVRHKAWEALQAEDAAAFCAALHSDDGWCSFGVVSFLSEKTPTHIVIGGCDPVSIIEAFDDEDKATKFVEKDDSYDCIALEHRL